MKTFIPPEFLRELHGSSLCPHVERYVTLLREQGYRARTVMSHIYLFRRFHRWLGRSRRHLEAVNEQALDDFLKKRERDSHDGAPQALRRLLAILRAAGAAGPAALAVHTPAQRLGEAYRTYLRVERSFAPKTIENYTRYIERFLSERFGPDRIDLRQLKLTEVIGFVRRMARDQNPVFMKGLVTALRSFLRYLLHCGEIETDWARSVPAVAHWHLTGLPKRLPCEAVERILAGCDQTTALGRRDHAILLLLARLGLRGVEVARMELEEIDWENARLTVRSRKGRGWARLPLPSEVGRAMARYLRHDRPVCACRNVFVRAVAPYAPFNNSAVVGLRVRAAMKRAGVTFARKGAHVFRHTLASEMLGHGASLDEIGQMLRHKDPDTTAIYAKVDLQALHRLAVPLPGGAA